MAQNRRLMESVSCSCGHGYCVFCVKIYLDQQRIRASCPESEVELLIGSQLELRDSQDLQDKLRTSKDVTEFAMESLALHRSRQSSRRGSYQVFLPVEEAMVETLQPDFSSREEFLQYSQEITLDPDSAFTDLSLSDGNKRVTNIGCPQNYIEHPDRFNFFWQVLSKQSLTGRCYWELEWSGPWVYVAVAYQNMQRQGNTKKCGFGGNDQSWALHCRKNNYTFWHKADNTQVLGPVESRIGVYLDHNAGVLTFYSVKDQTMTALHRVLTTFTQPLLAGVWVAVGATAVFCNSSKLSSSLIATLERRSL